MNVQNTVSVFDRAAAIAAGFRTALVREITVEGRKFVAGTEVKVWLAEPGVVGFKMASGAGGRMLLATAGSYLQRVPEMPVPALDSKPSAVVTIDEILAAEAASKSAPTPPRGVEVIRSKPATTLNFTARDNIALNDSLRQVRSSAEFCAKAGLDWTVEREAMITTTGLRVPEHYSLVRSDTRSVLDVVGSGYRVTQNADSLNVLNGLIAAGAQPVGAGSFGGGTTIFAQVDVGESRGVCHKDDVVHPYLLVRNGHGAGSWSTQWVMIRAVCWNTLTHACQTGALVGKIRHVGDVAAKLADVKAALDAMRVEVRALLSTYDLLGQRKVTRSEVQSILATVFPDADPEQVRAQKNRLEQRELVTDLLNGSGLGSEMAGHTGWGLLNAITEYNDHTRARQARTDAGRRESVLVGAIAEQKGFAFDTIIEQLGLTVQVEKLYETVTLAS